MSFSAAKQTTHIKIAFNNCAMCLAIFTPPLIQNCLSFLMSHSALKGGKIHFLPIEPLW